jgi:predicted transcriptional regulator
VKPKNILNAIAKSPANISSIFSAYNTNIEIINKTVDTIRGKNGHKIASNENRIKLIDSNLGKNY